jgi:hypothetical protein
MVGDESLWVEGYWWGDEWIGPPDEDDDDEEEEDEDGDI